MIQNGEEWLADQRVALPSTRTRTGWRNGLEKYHKVQQREVQSLAMGRNNPRHQYLLERSFAEKDLGILVDLKLSMRHGKEGQEHCKVH